MSNRAFFTQTNRALDANGDPVAGAKAFFYANRTTDMVAVYSDPAFENERSQPVYADAAGIFPAVFVQGSDAIRVLVTDENSVPISGYPIDDVAASGFGSTASGIGFSPTESLPYTDVQRAIEAAGALASDQTEVAQRALTIWGTGGTGNAYTISPSPAITGYGSWQLFLVRPDRANTGAATLNVNGLGTRNLRYVDPATGNVTDFASGELAAHRAFIAAYDGTQFIHLGERGITQADGDTRYLQKTGGSITGTLTLASSTTPTLKLDSTTAATNLRKWNVYSADEGSLFVQARLDSDAAAPGPALRIDRDADGITNIKCAMSAAVSGSSDMLNKARGDALYQPVASAQRFKENIETAEARSALGLEVRRWDWGGDLPENNPLRGETGYGLVADEVLSVCPEAVVFDSDENIAGLYALPLIGLLLSDMKRLEARIAKLEAGA